MKGLQPEVDFWLSVEFENAIVFRKKVATDYGNIYNFFEAVVEDKPVTMMEIWDIYHRIYDNDALRMY